MEPYKFPLSHTDQDFEALIERLTRDKHPDASVQKFGRKGQPQHGVDVLVSRADGTADGYQCKHVRSLGAATVLAEAAKASGLPGGLSRFIVYSTAPRDANDQVAARKATKLHKFLVVVSSWEDIAVDLMNNLGASQQYMAQLPLHDVSEEYMRQLRIVFDRPAFIYPSIAEWSHQEQLQAIKDVEEFLATGQLNTRDVRFVLRSLPASSVPKVRSHMSDVRKKLHTLRRKVTPAAKAEKKGDHSEVASLSNSIDAARIELMQTVNQLLQVYGVAPVRLC